MDSGLHEDTVTWTDKVLRRTFPHLLGETADRVGCVCQSRSRHFAPDDVADGVDEAGLAGADGSVQKDPEMSDVIPFWFIVPHELKVSGFVSVEKQTNIRALGSVWTAGL